MTDIRIPIPWDELDGIDQKRWCHDNLTYDEMTKFITRPITRKDLRSWDSLPIVVRTEYRTALCLDSFSAERAYNKAIDIATRPAPKLDPWEEMDHFVKDTDGWGDTRLSMIWEELKKAEGK